jgi:hypothetical protein
MFLLKAAETVNTDKKGKKCGALIKSDAEETKDTETDSHQ